MFLSQSSILKQGLSWRLLPKWTTLPRQAFHASSVHCKRRGPVSDVALAELIVDKPPNYYLTIQQKLDRINYYDGQVNDTNLGYEKNSEPVVNFTDVSKQLADELKFVDKMDNDLLNLEETSNIVSLNAEEYQQLSALHAYSKEYLDSTIALANHHAIFRDLFFRVPVELDTKGEIISQNAKSDNIRLVDVRTFPATFSFLPLVPIEAQFLIEDGEQFVCQRSHRGNLIPPEFGVNPPVITINTAAINGDARLEELTKTSNGSPVELFCGSKNTDASYYTLALVNLDSHFNDSGVCHWMLTNIHKSGSDTTFETAVKYLPIYGIRGLGYHRYSFVLFKHDKPIANLDKVEDFDLQKRKFNGLQFVDTFNSKIKGLDLKPVGLSWFQTTWNDNCTNVFYNYLNMRQPTYEYIYPKQFTEFKQLQFPGRAPFNLYLDHFRDPKEISKEVLLERLKSINPLESYDTKKMYPDYRGRPKFPHIHSLDEKFLIPDWLKSSAAHKRSLCGRYRGMRAASAILPHNNNADLDDPKWPRISPDVLPLNCPNPYPDGKRRPKPLRLTKWVIPLPEHHSLRVDFPENLSKDDKTSYENKSKASKG